MELRRRRSELPGAAAGAAVETDEEQHLTVRRRPDRREAAEAVREAKVMRWEEALQALRASMVGVAEMRPRWGGV